MSLNKSRWWWYRHRKSSRRCQPRNIARRLVYIAWIACAALATHQLLQVWSNTNLPISVQFSSSYRSAINYRGSLLVINNSTSATTSIGVGDLVAFRIEDRDVPIYHRIVTIHENARTGKLDILTKGDDNRVDDRGLYTPGQKWLERKDLYGKVVATPQGPVDSRLVGMLIIMLQENFLLQVFLFGIAIRSLLLDQSSSLWSRRPLQLVSLLPSVGSILFYFLVFSMILQGSVG